jgi:hypothetical protein
MITDNEIVELLARGLGSIQDDDHKVAMMLLLFGRRWAEVHERVRELESYHASRGDNVRVTNLRLISLR